MAGLIDEIEIDQEHFLEAGFGTLESIPLDDQEPGTGDQRSARDNDIAGIR